MEVQIGSKRRALARAGIALVLVFCASSVAMHVVQRELSPIDVAMSYYMNGRLGWIFGLGLVALGAGSLCVAAGLHLVLQPAGRAGSVLFAIWGLGGMVAGVFPPDPMGHWDEPPSLSGLIHGSTAMIAFGAFPAAAVLLSRRLRTLAAAFDHARLLGSLAWLSVLTTGMFFVCLTPAIVANRAPYVLGLVERLLVLFYVMWIVVAGLGVGAATRTGDEGDRTGPRA